MSLLLTGVLGVDPTVSGRFTSGQDWLGALVVDRRVGFGWSLAVPVSSGRELVAELCLGGGARLQAKPQRGWTELAGVVGGPWGRLAAGVSGNYLMLGSSSTALETMAPWLTPSSHAALAPEQPEAGMAGRLFASGFALQAIHAVARETWAPSLLSPALMLGSDDTSSEAPFAAMEQLLSARISAYLGELRGGDVHLRWQGNQIALSGDFRTRGRVQSKRGGALCRELAALPKGVRLWLAGTEATPQPPPGAEVARWGALPDWDESPGEWQRAVLRSLGTLGASFASRVSMDVPAQAQSGNWVLAWREHAGGSTALGVLDGVASTSLRLVPGFSGSHTGRLQSLSRDGRHLEWVWGARGNGTITAVGAALGEVWDMWSSRPPTTGWPRGISPAQCDALLAAMGTDAGVFAALLESADGVQVWSALDLSTVGGLLQ